MIPRRLAALALLLLLALVVALLLRKRPPVVALESRPEERAMSPAAASAIPEISEIAKGESKPAPGAAEVASAKSTIRGRVTDAITGAPIHGARVVAIPWDDAGPSDAAAIGDSDADGCYVLQVTPIWWRMSVCAEGYIPLQVHRQIRTGLEGGDRTNIQVHAPEGGEATFDAALAPGVMLTCLVTDEGGAPIEGAALTVTVHTIAHGTGGTGFCFDEDDGYSGNTDAQGRLRLGAFLPRGTLEIQTRHSGYAGKVAIVELTAGAQEARIILKRARTIAGIVVDLQGNPVAGAHLLLEDPGAWNPKYAGADQAGRFRFDDAPERSTRVSAWAEGFGLAGIRFGEADAPDLRLVLHSGRDVRGVVTDETGAPLPGVEVFMTLLRLRGPEKGTLIFQVEEQSGWELGGDELGGELPAAVEAPRAITNELGEFTLKGACPAENFTVHLAFVKEEYGVRWVIATPREAIRVQLVKGGEEVDDTQAEDESEEESGEESDD